MARPKDADAGKSRRTIDTPPEEILQEIHEASVVEGTKDTLEAAVETIGKKFMQLQQILGSRTSIADRAEGAPAFEANPTIRLNDLELTRATESTAILMSLFMGRGARANPSRQSRPGSVAIQAKTVRTLALDPMLGYLSEGHFRGTAVHGAREDYEGKLKQKLWSRLGEPFGSLRKEHDPIQELRFVLSPVDGVNDLVQGYDAGSISVLAGGAPAFDPEGRRVANEPFLDSLETEGDHEHYPDFYFVLVVGAGSGRLGAHLTNSINLDINKHEPICEALDPRSLVETLSQCRGKAQHEVTIATMNHNQPPLLRPVIGRHARLRTFFGSTVAAGITTLLPGFGIDAFLGVVRRAQVILLASAVRAIGGELYAIPLEPSPTRTGQRNVASRALPNAEVYEAKYFVPGENVFLVATGVSENLLLHGVRFVSRRRVETHTLVLSSGSQSIRFMTHHHDLRRKPFYMLDGPKLYDQIVQTYIDSGWLGPGARVDLRR